MRQTLAPLVYILTCMGHPAPVPDFRVPHGTERLSLGLVTGSILAHVLLVVFLAWSPQSSPPEFGGDSRLSPFSDDARGREITFLALAPPAPLPAPVEDRARVVEPLRFQVELTTVDLAGPRTLSDAGLLASIDRLPGGGDLRPGVGPGTSGPGRGEPGGGILPPQARYTVMPPTDRPQSVRGQSYRVRFFVDANGKVTSVEVSPEIPDPAYRKQFLELMQQYSFTPAKRQDGTAVPGETVLVITL